MSQDLTFPSLPSSSLPPDQLLDSGLSITQRGGLTPATVEIGMHQNNYRAWLRCTVQSPGWGGCAGMDLESIKMGERAEEQDTTLGRGE